MPWVRFDDQFTIHRKVDGLSDAAFRLHVAAVFWSARNLMDGFVPEEDLDLVCARLRAPARFAAECVAAGLWQPHEDGWLVQREPGWDIWRGSDHRAKIPDDVRQAVYQRDGYRCTECGSRNALSLDHIEPWSRFGSDAIGNLRTLCTPCNSSKGAG